MRISAYFMLAALALGLAGPVSAQLPWPFGPSPPEIPNPGDPKSMPACTSKYHKELQEQLAQLENLRGVQAERVLAFCDGIAQAERVLETLAVAFGMDKDALKEKLESQVEDLGKPLGIPKLNFRFVKHMCVQGAGEMERSIITEIGRLRSEIARCSGV